MKFLYHSASFVVFLLLLVLATTDISNAPNRDRLRGPPPTQLEWLIVFWVTGKLPGAELKFISTENPYRKLQSLKI